MIRKINNTNNNNNNNNIQYKSILPQKINNFNHLDNVDNVDNLDDYSKDEILINNLCDVSFEMVSNQLFITNFLSLTKPCNSLLLHHNNSYDKISSLITISEEMRENFY